MAKKINFDSLVKIAAGLAAGRSDVSREEFAMMVSVASERTGAGAESNPLDHGGPSAPTKSKTKK
jgi:pyrrolidone-carboxylate peptidase